MSGIGLSLQARIFASAKRPSSTRSWSLPVYFLPSISRSLEWTIGEKNNVVLNSRIAKQLGIRDGDRIVFEIYELNEVFRFRVSVMDNLTIDFIIHGAINLGIITPSVTYGNCGSSVDIKSSSGLEICNIPNQRLFSGLRAVRRSGKCILYFDGGCSNNPHGPNGWGFHINPASHPMEYSEMLITGYGYDSNQRSNNYMQYIGLTEGLRWAVRLDQKEIEIRGDSDLIINQITGVWKARNSKHKRLRAEVLSVMKDHRNEIFFSIKQIPRSYNGIADRLANLGMDKMESKVAVYWEKVNNVMRL